MNDEPISDFPELKDLSVDARAIVLTLGKLAMEVHLLREAWMEAPMQEINRIMLANLRQQQSGIAPVIAMPGSGRGH